MLTIIVIAGTWRLNDASVSIPECVYTITEIDNNYQSATLDLTPLSRTLIQYKLFNTYGNSSQILSYSPCESAASRSGAILDVPESYCNSDPGCWPSFTQYPFPTYNASTQVWTFKYRSSYISDTYRYYSWATINWVCDFTIYTIFNTINASYDQVSNGTFPYINSYMFLDWTISSSEACVILI